MPAPLPLHARLPALAGRLLDWAFPSLAAWAWGRAVAASPRSGELHFGRAQALARCGHWREAARSYAMAAHLSPTSVEYLGSLVVAYSRTGATEAALEALRRFADLRPGDGEVHVLIGTLQRQCGRPADALRSFRLAVALGRRSAVRFLLGEMLLGSERWEQTLRDVGLARDAGTAGETGKASSASALNFQPRQAAPLRDETPAAIPGARLAAILLRPAHRLAQACGGWFAVARESWARVGSRAADDLARRQRLRAIRRASRQLRRRGGERDLVLRLLLVSTLSAAGASAQPAAPPAQQPARPRAESPAAREQARLCERLSGEPAIQACRSALALGVAPARRAALRQKLALQLVALESWDELAELYREGVRLDPRDALAWQRLGTTLLYALGAPAEAIGALQEAVRLAPSDATARLALGMALASVDRPADAAREIERAVQLDPAILDSRPAARAVFEAARQGRRWP